MVIEEEIPKVDSNESRQNSNEDDSNIDSYEEDSNEDTYLDSNESIQGE